MGPVYTISRLGAMFGLSRSTLLYYDKMGLLRASDRSGAEYRLYSEEDKSRLEQIMVYRNIGVPLKKIREYLETPNDGLLPLLLNRLFEINGRIDGLRMQQQILLEMVEAEGTLRGKKQFLEKLKGLGQKAGVHEGNYEKIHRVFERTSPESHRRLLAFLGFSEPEIREFIKKLKQKD